MQSCEQQPAGTVPLTQLKKYFVPNRCLKHVLKDMVGGGRGVEARSVQSTASNHAKRHREPLIKLWGQPKMADW